ncbi:MAG: ATP-binding cassette domain-containing protein [Nitrospinae bacterium]|nr:ATP-binding cassette domain-containing protein [Nitrospinota bacterium]
MIEVQGLTKRFNGAAVVDGITFRVEKGEILGFLGPNGAGKTTTMRILSCYTPATSGTASVAGFDCFEEPLEVKKRVGYLPESSPLYKDMTVREFLSFAASVKGLKGGLKKQKMTEVMAETDVKDMADRLIGKLSKGYRQRVGLAQALINDPDVLILDEPTASLDPKQIVEIRQLIKNLSGKRTVILSTHILPEVSIVCDRVVIIDKGKVVAVDTPQNLSQRRQKKNVVHLTLDAPLEEAKFVISSVAGVTGLTVDGYVKTNEISLAVETEMGGDVRRQIAAAVVNKGWGLLEMRLALMSLEDIFVDLVTEEHKAEETQLAAGQSGGENGQS